MLRLGTIISLISMGKAALSPSDILFHRLLVVTATAVGLAFLVAMLVGTAIVGALYFSYYALVAQGTDPTTTFAILGVILLVLIGGFVAAMMHYINKLRHISNRLFTTNSPLPPRVSSIAEAFFSGLRHRPRVVVD